MPLSDPIVFERGDKLYIVGPVSTFNPDEAQIEEFAFAQELKKQAPNPHLVWMRGQYVEADKPNLNGQMWTAGELQVKSMTPMFMPVTVMHDPRTAVGLIADTKLLTPDGDKVPRSKIETALALWGHRFPEAVEEAQENSRLGTLMQSMECLAPDYSCSECGMTFAKLPDNAEREHWCDHLLNSAPGTEAANASRILGNVVFTGTGLIYGTRGAEGANPEAHLEVFQDEVAELHDRSHVDRQHRTRRTSATMPKIEVEQSEWERIQKERDDALAAKTAAEEAKAEAEKSVEQTEAAKVKAEEDLATEKKRADDAEEAQRSTTLRDERMGKLGSPFTAKLGEKTKAKLQEQAGKLSDDEWTARLDEVAELVGVKPDEQGDGDEADPASKDKDSTFGKDEIASATFGGGASESASEPSASERRSVIAGL